MSSILKFVLIICWGNVLYGVNADYHTYQSSAPYWNTVPNGLSGVASIAEVTSRNGRVSSSGGVKFYGTPESRSEYLDIQSNNRYSPTSVSHSSSGRSASASVQYSPGSVMVSSTAGNGYIPNFIPWMPQYQPPMVTNRIYSTPEEIFEHAKSFHPWLPRDLFRPMSPPKISNNYRAWSYPNFNPFESFWR